VAACISIIVAVLLGVAALTLFFWFIPRVAKSHHVVRSFERTTDYDAQAFREVRPEMAEKYVRPILFPLDLIMMACWAAALALGSVALGASVPSLAGKSGLLIALPTLYFISDLVEDILLARFLTTPAMVTEDGVRLLKVFTRTKMASLAAAHVQLVILAVLACLKTY
jgi:hypothetical protein